MMTISENQAVIFFTAGVIMLFFAVKGIYKIIGINILTVFTHFKTVNFFF